MRAAIYTRISKDPTGQEAGVTRQLEDCQALADRLGWTVVARFQDNDVSAFNGATRDDFEAMLAAIGRGEIDAIVCWHTDRLYRRVRDLQRLIDITDRVQIATVNAGDLDLSNSTGKMLARILGSVAEQESEHKGERRKRANEQRRASGVWRADQRRPFGYTQTGEPLEPEATAVREAVTEILSGRSLRSVCSEWNDAGLRTVQSEKRGGRRWTNLSLRRALLQPALAGLVSHGRDDKGRPKVVPNVTGDWEPLVDPDTWRGLVAYLTDPERRPAVTFERKHLGSGVYRCGVCGARLYALSAGAGRGMLYGCKPTKHAVRLAAPIDELVTGVVLKILRRAGIAAELASREGAADAAALEATRTRRTALELRSADLGRMFAVGEIDAAQLKTGSAELRRQITELDRFLAAQVITSPAAQLAADGPDDLEARWAALDPDIQGKIVDELMTVTVKPAPRGARTVDRDGLVNLDYLEVTPKV